MTGSNSRIWNRKYTLLYTGLACLVFAKQLQAPGDPYTVAAKVFLTEPTVGWALSPFLHQNPQHFFANMTMILLAGSWVEPRVPGSYYSAFAALTLYGTNAVEYAVQSSMTEKPVMVIGASGFGFALLAFYAVSGYRDIRWQGSSLREEWAKVYDSGVSANWRTLAPLVLVIALPVSVLVDLGKLLTVGTQIGVFAHTAGGLIGGILSWNLWPPLEPPQ